MKKILIIDDQQEIIDAFTIILEWQKHLEVKGVISVVELASVISNYQPDLIILDVVIGDVDGRMICSYLKNNHITSHIPIILTSASFIDTITIPCEPDALLEKPFEIADLEAKVSMLLNI